jgi:putative sigma-54 modulation protein
LHLPALTNTTMQIKIKGTNIELTPAITDYVNKRVESLNKFVDSHDESVLAYVEVGKTTHHHKNGDFFRAEINLHIRGKDLYAASEQADLYAAIDDVKEEMARELKSAREKKITLVRRGGAKLKALIRGLYKKE